MKYKRNGLLVMPGSKLGVIEEFLPGQGTYVEEGTIYSMAVGVFLIDKLKKTVSISRKISPPTFPRLGSIIVGRVVNLQSTNLEIKMSEVDGRAASGSYAGILHASNIKRGYVKTMSMFFSKNDIVRAKVFSTTNNIFHLSTDEKGLGVVYAACQYCGQPVDEDGLKCQICKAPLYRKFTSDYGNVKLK